jgi:acyl-coenzyme A synthetase/AMP-(fatty) acid ligase
MLRFSLLNCPDAELGSRVVAYRSGLAISARHFLMQVAVLAHNLPAGRYCLNVCQDRYHIALLMGAAMLRGQTNLLPPNRAGKTLEALKLSYPETYSVCETNQMHLFPDSYDIESLLEPSPTFKVDEGRVVNPSFDSDQIMGILFTSGSTGEPTANPRLWGALCQSARQASKALGLDRIVEEGPPSGAVSVIGTVPGQHSYGLESTIALCLQNGLALTREASFFPVEIMDALRSVPRPRILVTTPFHLKHLLEAHLANPAESSLVPPILDLVVSATAPLRPQLAALAERLFRCPVREIYGSTETGQIASRQTTASDTWTLFPDLAISVHQDNTWVSGGTVGNATKLNDVITLLSSSDFKLLGRLGDMVNIAGKRTSLTHLNFHLNSIEGIDDGLFVFANQAPETRDSMSRLNALVVTKSLNSAQILSALRERIDPVFLPRRIVMVPSISRNETGKVTSNTVMELGVQFSE